MKTAIYKSLLALLVMLFPALMSAQVNPSLDEVPTLYLMHAGGCHLEKNAEGRAIIKDASEGTPQKVTLKKVEGSNYYNILAPDGSVLTLKGNWETWFLDDPASKAAQYTVENSGKFFKKLKNRNNGKYLGTNDAKSGSYAYSDKDGNNATHMWYFSTDPTALPPVDEVKYVINPAAERQLFDGWGVSLCWWANMCGKWSDEKIDEIIDWLVDPEGLNFSIFRYNIGGGDDPENKNCDPHHMGKGKGLRAEMEGFKDSSDGPYIWTRDAAQRKIMLKIKEKRPDAVFEAFSNSAPYYMTYSGCVAGNSPSSKDNLKPEYYEEFCHYLVDVCKHYKDEYGIEFKTLDPFNEPMTSYWGKNGGQEGCHFDVNSQIALIKILYPILKESGLNTVISASDETSVAQAVKDVVAFNDAGILDMVGQINTHTYTADDKSRAKLSYLCQQYNKPLWMSEVGLGGSGFGGNLSLAQKLLNDMRFIMPSAWIDWQYIEENNDQWCLVRAGSFADGTYEKVRNYYVRSQFSRFIKKGYTILTTLNPQTLAARSPEGDELVLVTLNAGAAAVRHTVDLSMYASVGSDIRAYVTTEDLRMADFTGVELNGKELGFELPAMSIATFIIPVSADKNPDKVISPDGVYVVYPRNAAALGLKAVDGALKVNNVDFSKAQLWKLAASGTGYTFTNLDGDIITEETPNYALKTSKTAGEGQSFLVEPIDGIFYIISNGDATKAFDLEGENNTDGTGVGVWEYGEVKNAPIHRQWGLLRVPESVTGGIEAIAAGGSDAEAPVRVSTLEGAVQVAAIADTAGSLSIFNAAGACVYTHAIGAGESVAVPLTAGYYIVSYSGAAAYAAPVLVK